MTRARAVLAAGLLLITAAWAVSRLGRRVVAVEPGEIAQRVIARATLVPARGATRITVERPAQVLELRARPGDDVKEGQVLAIIEPLGPEGGRRRVELAATRQGTVLSSSAAEGDVVSPASEPIFEIADLSALEVIIDLDERDATKVRRAQRIELRRLGGGPLLGEAFVERMAPALQPRAGHHAAHPSTAPVRLAWGRVASTEGLLIGQPVEAVIALPPIEVAARVPREATGIEDGRVVVRTAGAIVDRTRVVTLEASDERFVGITGVPAGERVVLP